MCAGLGTTGLARRLQRASRASDAQHYLLENDVIAICTAACRILVVRLTAEMMVRLWAENAASFPCGSKVRYMSFQPTHGIL